MTKPVPFTVASLARAIKGVELAGRFVIGVKSDGTLIVGDRPIETASFVPEIPDNVPQEPQTRRRIGEKLYGDQDAPASKWEDKRG